jgi:hypothetical protein
MRGLDTEQSPLQSFDGFLLQQQQSVADIVKIGGPMRSHDFVRLGKQFAGFRLNPTLLFEKFGGWNIQPTCDSLMDFGRTESFRVSE